MNTYCIPNLYNQRLGKGDRISILLYKLNTANGPNYYRNNFNSKDKLNKTMSNYKNKMKKIERQNLQKYQRV